MSCRHSHHDTKADANAQEGGSQHDGDSGDDENKAIHLPGDRGLANAARIGSQTGDLQQGGATGTGNTRQVQDLTMASDAACFSPCSMPLLNLFTFCNAFIKPSPSAMPLLNYFRYRILSVLFSGSLYLKNEFGSTPIYD
jgi:hypothetical protein